MCCRKFAECPKPNESARRQWVRCTECRRHLLTEMRKPHKTRCYAQARGITHCEQARRDDCSGSGNVSRRHSGPESSTRLQPVADELGVWADSLKEAPMPFRSRRNLTCVQWGMALRQRVPVFVVAASPSIAVACVAPDKTSNANQRMLLLPGVRCFGDRPTRYTLLRTIDSSWKLPLAVVHAARQCKHRWPGRSRRMRCTSRSVARSMTSPLRVPSTV